MKINEHIELHIEVGTHRGQMHCVEKKLRDAIEDLSEGRVWSAVMWRVHGLVRHQIYDEVNS